MILRRDVRAHNYSELIPMDLSVSSVESMGSELFKSVSDVFIASLADVIHFGEILKYAKNPNSGLLPQIRF